MDFVFALIAIGLFAAGSLILDRKNRAKLGWNRLPADFVSAFFGNLQVTRKKTLVLGWQYNKGVFRGYELELGYDDCRGGSIAVAQITHGAVVGGVVDILRKSGPDTFMRVDAQSMKTGDEKFDGLFQVTVSNEVFALSLLGPETRRMVADIAGPVDYFHFTEKQCSAGVRADRDDAVGQLVTATRKITELLDAIREGGDARQRLMMNIRREKNTAAKLACLRHLVTTFPADGEILDLLGVLLDDESASVQFEAACHLGETGMKHITLLMKKGRLDAVETGRAVAILGRNRCLEAVPVLRGLYAKSDAGMKVEILKAFCQFADTKLNGFLAGETRSRNRDLRLHAVKALANCGTVDSVELLYRLAHGKGDPVLAAPARESMEVIQARLTGAQGGWLSEPETAPMDGALSRGDGLAEGALSVHAGDRVSKKKKKTDR